MMIASSYILTFFFILIQANEEETFNHNNNNVNCPPCECTPTDFENLQNNLDSCLTTNKERSEAIESYKETITTLESQSQSSNKKQEEKELLLVACQEEKTTFETQIQNLQDQLSDQETLYKTEKRSFKTTITNLQTEINTVKQSHVTSTGTIQKELQQAQQKTQSCQKELQSTKDSQAELEGQLDEYETKHSKLTTKYNVKVKELRSELSNLSKELETSKKSLKTMQDRYYDTKQENKDLDAELRRMHYNAQRTYVNTTLMKEDMVGLVMNGMDKSLTVVDNVMRNDKVQSVYGIIKEKMMDLVVKPLVPLYQKNVRPHIDMIGNKLKSVDAIESVRRLAVSFIQQGATITLNYMELTKDNNSRTRVSPSRRRIRAQVVAVLGNMKRNPASVVSTSVQLFFGYLILKIFFWVLRMLFFRPRESINGGEKRARKVKLD